MQKKNGKKRLMYQKIFVSTGADGNGRPKVATTNCDSNVDKVELKFHGSLSFLLNLVRGPIQNAFKGVLNKQVCFYHPFHLTTK